MAFPGIISRLHPVSCDADLERQLRQGSQYRAEAFWLPASQHAQSKHILAILSDKCSLFLEQDEPQLTLRNQDGVLRQAGQLVRCNGQRIILATRPGDQGLVTESALAEMDRWLAAGHQHYLCPAAVQPVARAILNIWPLDPYLARHFLASFTPLLQSATELDYLDVFRARDHQTVTPSAWVAAYMKLEKKLHRAYLEH